MSFHSVLNRFRQEVAQRGLLEAGTKVCRALADRLRSPWYWLLWLPLEEFVPQAVEAGLFHVVTTLGDEPVVAQLKRRFDEVTMNVFERRLANGCHLHVLLKDGMIAGTLFVVFGKHQPFQHVTLTDRDAAILDSHIQPELRGQGLYAIFLNASLASAKDLGIQRMYVATTESNLPSLRALYRVGFRQLLKYKVSGGRYRYDTEPL